MDNPCSSQATETAQTLRSEFYAEEYRRVGTALEAKVLESTDLVKYVVLSSSAVLAWLTAADYEPTSSLRAFGWGVPIAICLFGWLRSWGIGVQMEALTAYLKAMEAQFANSPSLQGYQTFNASRIRAKRGQNCLFRFTDINWFYALLAIACGACWFLARA